MVIFKTKEQRDTILRHHYKKSLKIEGKGIILFKEIPKHFLALRNNYTDLATTLRKKEFFFFHVGVSRRSLFQVPREKTKNKNCGRERKISGEKRKRWDWKVLPHWGQQAPKNIRMALKICSWNVNILNSPRKRSQVYHVLARQNLDVICLQETHVIRLHRKILQNKKLGQEFI